MAKIVLTDAGYELHSDTFNATMLLIDDAGLKTYMGVMEIQGGTNCRLDWDESHFDVCSIFRSTLHAPAVIWGKFWEVYSNDESETELPSDLISEAPDGMLVLVEDTSKL